MLKTYTSFALATLGILLSSCGDSDTVQTAIFSNSASCKAYFLDHKNDERVKGIQADCERDYSAALAQHERNPPLFVDQQDCMVVTSSQCQYRYNEADKGKTGYWIPEMTAYMLSSGDQSREDAIRAQPLYHSRVENSFLNSYGEFVFDMEGIVSFKRTDARLKLPPQHVKGMTGSEFLHVQRKLKEALGQKQKPMEPFKGDRFNDSAHQS